MKNLIRSAMVLTAPVFCLLMINCAGTPEINPVQDVQNSYNRIKNDTLVTIYAPNALQKAEEAVKKVQKSMKQDVDQRSLEKKILIAQQRVEIARKTAELRAAKDQIKHSSAELQALKHKLRQEEGSEMNNGLTKLNATERAKQLTYFRAQKTNRGLILRFKNLKFASEKATLQSSVEQPINELVDFLNRYPERSVVIEGYTDNTGAKSLNKKLSQQRAKVVRDALVARGIAETRVKAVGLGEQHPIASNKTAAGRRANRRVEVVISDKNEGFKPSQ